MLNLLRGRKIVGETSKTPLGFWIISGLSLLWNAFGAFDYTMTQTKNAEYLAAFTPEQRTSPRFSAPDRW